MEALERWKQDLASVQAKHGISDEAFKEIHDKLLKPPTYEIDGHIISVCPDKDHSYWHTVRRSHQEAMHGLLREQNQLAREANQEKQEEKNKRKQTRKENGEENETDCTNTRNGAECGPAFFNRMGAAQDRAAQAKASEVAASKERADAARFKSLADLRKIMIKMQMNGQLTKADRVLLVMAVRKREIKDVGKLKELKAKISAPNTGAQCSAQEAFDALGTIPWAAMGVSMVNERDVEVPGSNRRAPKRRWLHNLASDSDRDGHSSDSGNDGFDDESDPRFDEGLDLEGYDFGLTMDEDDPQCADFIAALAEGRW